jgi:hypothetical protein
MVADLNSCGWFSPTTGRFTPTVAGYYQVNAQVGITNSTGSIVASMYCNGVDVGSTRAPNNVCNLGTGSAFTSSVVYMNGTTDYLQLSGASTVNPATLAFTRFSAALMGAVTTLPATYNISQFPTWTSAGTVQSVGISAVTTPPTVGATTPTNNVRYRQIGPKEWEVQVAFHQTGSGARGSGDYLFTLPAGLQFDVSSPFQKPYTGTPSNANGWFFSNLINSWSMIANTGSSTYAQMGISVYDATRYRVLATSDYGSMQYVNAFWYELTTAPLWYKWGFTFTTP